MSEEQRKKALGVWSNPENLDVSKIMSHPFYNVPTKLEECEIDTCKGKAKKILVSYFEDFATHYEEGRGIMFWCPEFGTGKSGAAAAALRKCLFYNIMPYFTSCADLVSDIVQRKVKDDVYDTAEYVRLIVDVLIIDDLKIGSGKWGSMTAQIIEDTLKYRADTNRPTIITTNMSMSEIETQFGKSVEEIILATCIPVKLDDENWRQAIKQENLDYSKKYLK